MWGDEEATGRVLGGYWEGIRKVSGRMGVSGVGVERYCCCCCCCCLRHPHPHLLVLSFFLYFYVSLPVSLYIFKQESSLFKYVGVGGCQNDVYMHVCVCVSVNMYV